MARARPPTTPEGARSSPRFKKRSGETKPPESSGPRMRFPNESLVEGIPQSHYELIGGIIVQFSKLEGVIQEVIWHFLDLSIEEGRIITCLNDVSGNTAILRALCRKKIKSKPILEKFNIRLNRLQELAEARNKIAHGIWCTQMPDGLPGVLSLRKKVPDLGLIFWEGISEAYLRVLIKRIDDEKEVWKGLSPEPPTLPETLPQQPPEP